MSGLLDMDGHHIHGLGLPIHPQDPWRRIDSETYIQPYLHNQGARARSTIPQVIPTHTHTPVIFDTEDYDNDNMWEGVTNPNRLTIQTTGMYLIIGQLHWDAAAPGYRGAFLWHSIDTWLAQVHTQQATADDLWRGQVLTTWYCLAGEYLELRARHTSGAPLDVRADTNQSPVLSAVRISS
ncbi:hypothetical protein ES703_104770 [subsurface metagenome]